MAKKEMKEQMGAIARKMPEMKPRIDVNSKDIPAIKDWEVGKNYEVRMKMKMIEKRQGNRYPMEGESADKTIRAAFECVDMKPETHKE